MTVAKLARLLPLTIGLALAGCSDDSAPKPDAQARELGGGDAALRDLAARDQAGRDAQREAQVGDSAGSDRGARDLRRDLPADLSLADGQCGVYPQPDPDPWTLRHPSAGFGGIVTGSSGGHTDVFLKSPTDYVRIGSRLDWGGTVVFFGLSSSASTNVIDANDTGRELQLALYDPSRIQQGCAHDASCQSGALPCEASITYLGWNPVQGGDECGHGAPVLSHGQVGDALQLVIQPIQWNPEWDAPDCRKSSCSSTPAVPVEVTYTFELRFVREHVVEVMSQVTSQETIDHPLTGQEFPTLYVSHGNGGPDLPTLVDAAGSVISLTTPGNDGFYYGNFSSPRPYVSWQNTQLSYGVGLAMDQGITAFQGWRGDGATAPYFHNVRAQIQFGLPAGGTVRGISYLALGGLSTVQAELEAVLGARPPFGHVDVPAEPGVSYSPGSPVEVQGWVLDTTPIANVRLEVDGVPAGTIPVTTNRPDVCQVYPAYADCPQVGFAGQLQTAGLGGPCPHLLRVLAEDPDGNVSLLAERRLTPQ